MLDNLKYIAAWLFQYMKQSPGGVYRDFVRISRSHGRTDPGHRACLASDRAAGGLAGLG
jgi:hypothetical protein